ncbi:MAG TPA: redox-regulated ATPase YchF [Nitrospiria bacterium]|nr:redox-regulated ATPase YchF [Nitrospiria bacterium]
MSLKCGIVGLPNVGKSTVFNALLESAKAAAANYPFTTIEPNVGIVEVPDERPYRIADLEGSPKVTPTYLECVDIAGLVRNASKGEGLGNQFLSHIREADAIIEVLRCFENADVVHVEGSINPVRDAQTVDIELIAKDIEGVEKRLERAEKSAKGGSKEAKEELEHLKRIKVLLDAIQPLRKHIGELPEETVRYARDTLFLLTIKPVLYLANISEADLARGDESTHLRAVKEMAPKEGSPVVALCAELEAQLSQLPKEERGELLEAYGLKETGLHRLIREGYKLLNLITFFTTNEKETRAWTVLKGIKAPQAAGKVHSDFEKGFIAADVINYATYIEMGSLTKAREKGLVRLEGRDYEVKDGDIIYFRSGV